MILLVAAALAAPAPTVAVPPAPPAGLAPDATAIQTRHESWTRPAGAPKTDPVDVALPRILVGDPSVQAKVDALLVPDVLLGDPKDRLLQDGWVDAVSFEVPLDRAGVVSILVHVEGSAAYPDHYERALVLDARTGARIGASAFTPAGRTAILDRANAEVRRLRDAADRETREMIADVALDASALDGFWLTDAGLVLHVPWGLPHAMLAGAPDDTVVVPWDVVAAALVPGSPLARALAR